MSASPRMLIVEDEPLMAMLLTDLVGDLGYDVLGPIAREDEAVDESERQKPDVILMDIRLADGGNGLEAARQIRRASDTPIVFCTSEPLNETLRDEIMKIGKTGKTGFVEKLQVVEQLAPAVAKAIAS